MQIEEVREVTNELVEALQRLLPQLSPTATPPTRTELVEIVTSPATTLFIARAPNQANRIVGTLTLVRYRIPTGLKVWIEDVVVDEAARGQGVGAALSKVALQHAAAYGAEMVDLTSRPAREAANRLYQQLGFVKRDTNVYRYTFPKQS